MTNRWNRIIYRLWAPVYDPMLSWLFLPGRKRALELLDLKPGETVLIVGVGTGADLPLLPAGVHATGVDLSPEMLARARQKLCLPGRSANLIRGDAQQQLIAEESIDAAIFHLILSVVPDGRACLQENLRSLKPGGRAVIFDKFMPEGKSPSLIRKFLNRFSTLLGTDINRRLSDLISDSRCAITHLEPSIAGGVYQVILLKKAPTPIPA